MFVRHSVDWSLVRAVREMTFCGIRSFCLMSLRSGMQPWRQQSRKLELKTPEHSIKGL